MRISVEEHLWWTRANVLSFKPDLKLFSLDKIVNKNVPDKNNYVTHLHAHALINIENAEKNGTDTKETLRHFYGLIDLDVSCYANSILQCLFNIECINSVIKLSCHSEFKKKICLDFLTSTYITITVW